MKDHNKKESTTSILLFCFPSCSPNTSQGQAWANSRGRQFSPCGVSESCLTLCNLKKQCLLLSAQLGEARVGPGVGISELSPPSVHWGVLLARSNPPNAGGEIHHGAPTEIR